MSEDHLPSCRIFLLRLSDAALPREGVYRGRIEHIPSGRSVRFDSLHKLDEFVQEVLSTESGQGRDEHIKGKTMVSRSKR